MIYDKEEYTQAKEYLGHLISKNARIEIKNKNKVTTKLNSYIHLIISFFALETGYSIETVKVKFFKILLSSDIFVTKEDGELGVFKTVKSINKCTTKELSTAVDRFLTWSVLEVGISLPDPSDKKGISYIEKQVNNNKF